MGNETKTHWKKMNNPDYLGAYAFQPGQDIIATINVIKKEIVTGSDGKKEECSVMHFKENEYKPLILNSTNAKTIEKLFKTPYIEDWVGKRIQLYVQSVRAFGDTVDAVRVRAFLPKVDASNLKCADCKKAIQGVGNMSALQVAAHTSKRYGKQLCAECATKIANEEAEKAAEKDAL